MDLAKVASGLLQSLPDISPLKNMSIWEIFNQNSPKSVQKAQFSLIYLRLKAEIFLFYTLKCNL